ncbi:MAG: Ig-like domain-containing protein [Eubacterium sp.]|nr:Ig-like domain-containing protein [Eubacterium sp.]
MRQKHYLKYSGIAAVFVLLILVTFFSETAFAADSAARKAVPFSNKTIYLKWDLNSFKKPASGETDDMLGAAAAAITGNASDGGYGKHKTDKVEKTIKALGFTKNIQHLNYEDPKVNQPGMTFALNEKKIGKKRIVLAAFKGTSTGEDVLSDLNAQLNGFQTPGENALKALKAYLKKHNLDAKNTILYITGYSYGAAVASRVAIGIADIIPKKNTFVYTIACPNYYVNGISKTGWGNIHNYVNASDPVPKVPVRTDCGKIGSTETFDYKNTKNYGRRDRFDLAFYYLKNTRYSKCVEPMKDHMDYMYMSLILSKAGTTGIQDSFASEMIVPRLSKVTSPKAEKVKITWKKVTRADGYEVLYSGKKTKNYKVLKKVEGKNTLSCTKKGLKGGKKYYFKVRSYVNIGGHYFYSDYSGIKSVTIKKAVPSVSLNRNAMTITAGQTKTLTATVKNYSGKVKWKSSDKRVASVSSGGKVKAKKAGTAVITVTAGSRKAVCKVKVKKARTVDLAKYYRKPYSSVVRKFPGGADITWYAEYDEYRYKDAVTFFFPKPVADQKQAPLDMIALDKKMKGYNLLGVTVGMNRETAFKKLRKAGFKRTVAVGITYYWEGSNSRQVQIEADSKVRSIRYGAW